MGLKSLFNEFFSYTPENDYQFIISEDENKNNQIENQKNSNTSDNLKISSSLSVNIEYMKTRYNLLINSDIIFREFTLNAYGKQYNAFLIYIDGLVNSEIMDNFILKPLMLRNKSNLYDGAQNKIISESVNNKVTIRKIKKFDLPNYLMGCLLPQNAVKQISNFDDAAVGINSR